MPLDWPIGCPRHLKKKMFDGISTGSKCATWVPQNDMKRPNEFSFFRVGITKSFYLMAGLRLFESAALGRNQFERICFERKTKKNGRIVEIVCVLRDRNVEADEKK